MGDALLWIAAALMAALMFVGMWLGDTGPNCRDMDPSYLGFCKEGQP